MRTLPSEHTPRPVVGEKKIRFQRQRLDYDMLYLLAVYLNAGAAILRKTLGLRYAKCFSAGRLSPCP